MILTVCPNPSVDKFIHLDMFRPGAVHKSISEQAFPGGKGVHVALAVAELGMKSSLAAFWGGPTGRWVRQQCEKAGISCSGPELDDWTRTCLTIKTESGNGDTEIRERGPAVSAVDTERLLLDVENRLKTATALCVSGSWPPGSPGNVYSKLQTLAEKYGIPLWVDAAGVRLRQAVDVRPFGIHINRAEAESLFGAGKHPSDYAGQLLDHCSLAAVTNGADGLYLARENTIVHASCPVEPVLSTVGCGDCLLAGLVVSHARKQNTEQMARTATACGTANCIRPELGMIHKEDAERLEEHVRSTVSDVKDS